MKTRSLVRRATVTVLAIELLCAVGFASFAIWHERAIRLHALDATLAGRCDSLVGAVQDAEDPADNVMVDAAEFSPPSSDEYAVYNPDGRLVGTSHGDLSAVNLGEREGFHNLRAAGHAYRVLQKKGMRIIDRYETGGVGLRRPITVVYAARSDRVWHEVMEAVRFYVLLSAISVGITAILLIALAGRLLHPLNELASAAAAIEPVGLKFAPPDSALSTTELRPLADALAGFVTRLRQAFEAERRFISDAAHELKTAVAVVRSSIQVLAMKTRSEEEYREGLDRILDDNQRAEELVASMLTLARFDEVRTDAREEVKFGDETERVVRQLSTYAENRDVTLRFTTNAPDARMRISPQALETLVSNLILNAIQHSARGSEIEVAVRSEGSRGILEVRDCGEGIAAENLPHVFERFFREDSSRSRETGGAGLGLSICKSIVDSVDGTLEIQSEKGIGTVVSAHFDLLPRLDL